MYRLPDDDEMLIHDCVSWSISHVISAHFKKSSMPAECVVLCKPFPPARNNPPNACVLDLVMRSWLSIPDPCANTPERGSNARESYRKYRKNEADFHLPNLWMRSTVTPCMYKEVAPPALRGWVPTTSGLTPFALAADLSPLSKRTLRASPNAGWSFFPSRFCKNFPLWQPGISPFWFQVKPG